jgi:hypothetical protein
MLLEENISFACFIPAQHIKYTVGKYASKPHLTHNNGA